MLTGGLLPKTTTKVFEEGNPIQESYVIEFYHRETGHSICGFS